MSDQVPPPTPGTRPRPQDDFVPSLPVHRPDPAAYERERRTGRIEYRDPEVRARMDAIARELDPAQAGGPPPGAAWEVPSIVGVQAAEAAHEETGRRVVALKELETTGQEHGHRARDLGEATEAVATVEAAMPAEPPLGLALTHPLLPLVPLPLLVFLELQFTATSIGVALPDATNTLASVVAGIVAAVLTLAAEIVALVVGAGLARAGRRVVLAAGAGVALLLAALCVWTVVALAGSRTTNVAYRDAHRPPPATTAGGSFGVGAGARAGQAGAFGAGTAGTASQAGGFGSARPGTFGGPAASAKAVPGGPDLGFVVPITLLALAIGLVLSLRCGAAHPWRAAVRDRDAARADRAGAQAACDRAEVAHGQAVMEVERVDLEFAATIERLREHGDLMLNRLQAEFERACHARGAGAAQLARPQLPSAEALIHRSFDPVRAPATRPDLGPRPAAGPGGGPAGGDARPYFSGGRAPAPGPQDAPAEPQDGAWDGPIGDPPPPEPQLDLWGDADGGAPAGEPGGEPALRGGRFVREDDRPAGFSWFDDEEPADADPGPSHA